MSDARLRELERRWKETGSPDDEAAYLLERVRVGDLTRERLELAASTGSHGACRASGVDEKPLEAVLKLVLRHSPDVFLEALLRLGQAAFAANGKLFARDIQATIQQLMDSTRPGKANEGLAETLYERAFELGSSESAQVSRATILLTTQAAFHVLGRVAPSFYCETTPDLLKMAGVAEETARTHLRALLLGETRWATS